MLPIRDRALLRHAPESDGSIATGGESAGAVGGEENAADFIRVTLEALDFLAALDVPQARRMVRAALQRQLAVRRGGQAVDLIGVPFEASNDLAALGVTNAD